jgi:Cytochrome P450
MIFTPVTLILLILTVFTVYKYCTHRPSKFPPGPPKIPILGSYLFLLLINYDRLHVAVMSLCERYKSTIIGFWSGRTLVVTANDYESVREVLFNSDFDGRNDFFVARLRSINYKLSGIFFTDGGYWQHQRRFALRNLRDFGFGRRFECYESEVKSEMENLIEMIESGVKYEHERAFLKSDGNVLLPKIFIGTIGNCFLQVSLFIYFFFSKNLIKN